jgi:GTP-binding protein
LKPLFDTIINYIPQPEETETRLQMLVSAIDYNDYVGRIGIGRIEHAFGPRGKRSWCAPIMIPPAFSVQDSQPYEFDGLKRNSIELIEAGDICCLFRR